MIRMKNSHGDAWRNRTWFVDMVVHVKRNECIFGVGDDDGDVVIKVHKPCLAGEESWEEHESFQREVATFLSAAPDLFAACEAAADYIERIMTKRQDPMHEFLFRGSELVQLRAAIRKAKGERLPKKEVAV